MQIKQQITYYLLLTIFLLFVNCKKDSSSDLLELESIDSHKTSEVLKEILNDEDDKYLMSSCILEKPLKPFDLDEDDLKRTLNINDTLHYKLQLKFYRDFKLNKDFISKKNLLSQKQIDEFETLSNKGGFKFWDWLENNCDMGYCYITKPIFNEEFNLAYVEIGVVCGRLCGEGEKRIYELVEGKWILKETYLHWVS